MNDILITKEAAEMLRISEEYLRELIRAGKIKAYKEGRRGGYRITRQEINNYVKMKHEEEEKTKVIQV